MIENIVRKRRKGESSGNQQIPPFTTMFSKGSFLWEVKTRDFVEMGVMYPARSSG